MIQTGNESRWINIQTDGKYLKHETANFSANERLRQNFYHIISRFNLSLNIRIKYINDVFEKVDIAIKTSICVIRGFCNLMATKVIYLIPSNSTRKFDCRKCLTLNMFDIFKPKINICLDQKYIYCPIAFLYQKWSKISTFVWLCQWMPAKSKITEQWALLSTN